MIIPVRAAVMLAASQNAAAAALFGSMSSGNAADNASAGAGADAAAAAAATGPQTDEEAIAEISTFFSKIWEDILNRIPLLLIAALLLFLGILLSRLTLRLMKKGFEKSKVDLTISHFLISLVKIALYLLIATVVLALLGIPTSSIIAVISTAGVAIGLALQNSLSNIAGGFIILMFKPFRVGNYILVNGTEGFVESINILYTKLRTYNNRYIYIPNGVASGGVLTNATEADFRRVDKVFSISYDSDYTKAIESIYKAIKKIPKAIDTEEHKTFVRMWEHNTSSIDIMVRVWCNTPDYWDVYADLVEQVRVQFIEDNIEIPYQQLDVHMKNK